MTIFHRLELIRLRFMAAREDLRRAGDLNSIFPLLTGLLYLCMGLLAARREGKALRRKLRPGKKHKNG